MSRGWLLISTFMALGAAPITERSWPDLYEGERPFEQYLSSVGRGAGSENPRSSGTGIHYNSQDAQQPSVTRALIQSAPQTDKPHRIDPQPRHEANWYTSPDWWIAGFTGLLFAATAGLWFATWSLWKITSKAVSDGARAAEAAERSVNLAERALTELERAYIFVEVTPSVPGGNIRYPIMAEDHPLKSSVQIKNLGKTPAVLRKIRGYHFISERTPASLLEDPTGGQSISDGLAISTGGVFVEVLEISISPSDRENLLTQSTGLFVCGEITYEDFLGKEHRTGFCWQARITAEMTYFISPNTPLNYRT